MKIWAWVAIVAAIIAAFGSTYAFGKSAGYDKRSTELQNEILDAVAKAKEQDDKDWQKLLDAAEGETVVEEKIVTEIQYVEKEITKTVKEYVTPECRDLGPAVAGLLNDQVRAANGVQGPEVTASLAYRLPGYDRISIW